MTRTPASHAVRRQSTAVAARSWVVIAATALVILMAACSGPSSAGSRGSSAATGSRTSPSAVAYSACMRSKGVPNYPDPDSSGNIPKTDAQVLGVSSARYRAAQQACRHLLPTGGTIRQREYLCMQNSDCPPALVQQMLAADRKLARCMRSHGVPNFPDPTTDSHGPIFNITRAGISDAASHSRQFIADLNTCSRLVGANAPESFE